MKKYFPILLSKAGELSALSHLSQSTKEEICPIIKVLPDTYNNVETAFSSWNFEGNKLFLDFSLFTPFNSDHINNLMSNLTQKGVDITLVLQSNSPRSYTELIKRLLEQGKILNLCLRFPSDEDESHNISEKISTYLLRFNIEIGQISILLDYGYLNDQNYNLVSNSAIQKISSLTNLDQILNVIVASGSFPENLGSLSPSTTPHLLQRYEWNLWQALQNNVKTRGLIKYSDYGTKNPSYIVARFKGSCSIKYTLPSHYLIYRGELSQNHPHGNGQYIIFAKLLVQSTNYKGSTFCWGDQRISYHAEQQLTDPNNHPGNGQTWVAISQNHHISLVTSLL